MGSESFVWDEWAVNRRNTSPSHSRLRRSVFAAGFGLAEVTGGVITLSGTAATPIGHVAGVMNVSNAGTIVKSSATAQTIDNALTNTGTIAVNGGLLTVNAMAAASASMAGDQWRATVWGGSSGCPGRVRGECDI